MLHNHKLFLSLTLSLLSSPLFSAAAPDPITDCPEALLPAINHALDRHDVTAAAHLIVAYGLRADLDTACFTHVTMTATLQAFERQRQANPKFQLLEQQLSRRQLTKIIATNIQSFQDALVAGRLSSPDWVAKPQYLARDGFMSALATPPTIEPLFSNDAECRAIRQAQLDKLRSALPTSSTP